MDAVPNNAGLTCTVFRAFAKVANFSDEPHDSDNDARDVFDGERD